MANNNLDMDDIQAQINARLDRHNGGESNDMLTTPVFDNFGLSQNSPVADEPEEKLPEVEQRHLHLEAPFVIVQYRYDPADADSDEKRIESFELTAEGIPGNPQVIAEHLRAVLDHLEGLGNSFENADEESEDSE